MQANVLNNFEKDDVAANICRLLLAVTMFFTYPMEFFVARHALVSTFWGDEDIQTVKHFAISIVLWAITLIIGPCDPVPLFSL